MAGTKDDRSTRGRSEIDRVRLRKILLDSLPEGFVRWGCRLQAVEQNVKTGDVQLDFDHGTESGFDLVVGADSA